MPSTATPFKSPAAFRRWLLAHHATETELLVQLFKVHAKHRGMTYREALDEALCFGWIDGVVRGIDSDSFSHRFTPRKSKSYWSAVNIARARELEAAGRMHASGLAAFRAADLERAPRYSFESKTATFDPERLARFQANRGAWAFFQTQPPSYRRVTTFLVMSAKQEATRDRRLATLIRHSAHGERLPQVISRPAIKPPVAKRVTPPKSTPSTRKR